MSGISCSLGKGNFIFIKEKPWNFEKCCLCKHGNLSVVGIMSNPSGQMVMPVLRVCPQGVVPLP